MLASDTCSNVASLVRNEESISLAKPYFGHDSHILNGPQDPINRAELELLFIDSLADLELSRVVAGEHSFQDTTGYEQVQTIQFKGFSCCSSMNFRHICVALRASWRPPASTFST